jgi:hypothetical protein
MAASDATCLWAVTTCDSYRVLGAAMVRAPEEGPWVPGYYSLSFLDPDAIRLKVNHVPGKGVFAEGTSFDPASDYPLEGRRGS